MDLSGLFQRSFRYLSGTFQGSFRDNSGRSHGSFMDLSGIFQSVIFQGSFKNLSENLSGIFQGYFRALSISLRNLSRIFQGSCMNLSLSLSILVQTYLNAGSLSVSLKLKKKLSQFFSPGFILKFLVDIFFNLSWSLVTASYLSFVSYFIFIFSLSSPRSPKFLSVCLSRGQSLFFHSLDFNLWRSYSIFTVYSCLIPGKNLKKIQIFERKNCFHVWS